MYEFKIVSCPELSPPHFAIRFCVVVDDGDVYFIVCRGAQYDSE